MVTFEQSIVPSSGSVTVTLHGTLSPKDDQLPATGPVTRHRRRGVADADLDTRRSGGALRVPDRQRRGVGAVGGVGLRGVGRGRGGAVAERPRVGQRAALRVAAAGRGEVHGQRCRARRSCWRRRRRSGRGCCRCRRSRSGTAPSSRRRCRSRRRSPGRTARRRGRTAMSMTCLPIHGKESIAPRRAVGVDLDRLDPAAAELAGEELPVERCGNFVVDGLAAS